MHTIVLALSEDLHLEKVKYVYFLNESEICELVSLS